MVDLVFPAWPATTHRPGGDVLEVDTGEFPGADPALSVLVEDAAGHRRLHRTVKLPTRSRLRIVGAIPTIAEGERIVLVLRATIGRHQLTTESLLERPVAVRDDLGDAAPGTLAPNVRGVTADGNADARDTEAGADIPPTDGTVQPVGEPDAVGEASDDSSANLAPGDGKSEDENDDESEPAAEASPVTKVPGQVPGGQVPGGPSGTDSSAPPPGDSPGLVATPKTEQL
ncbi:MAG: hypothetical protein JKY87_05885 [Mariprofundus sp.]|nr:hypothetical protein [Mariprofundus sp.]